MQNKIIINKNKEIQRLGGIKLDPGIAQTGVHLEKTDQID